MAAIDDVAGALLKAAGLNFAERRRVQRDLDEISDRLASRLEPLFTAESFRAALSPTRAEAAAGAVAMTIDRGFTSPDVALAADLDPEKLERLLREASPTAAEDALLLGAGDPSI